MSENLKKYEQAWESFWGTLTGKAEEVLWNVPFDQAVALDFERFKSFLASNSLPLVDMGCGDGTQTPFFGDNIDRVIGVDVSAHAIEIARKEQSHPNVEYDVLDLLDTAACQAFQAKFGDTNIYMRGVLMQFSLDDRILAADNLKILMGATGFLYMNEYVPETKDYYQGIFKAQGMPEGFARVLQHGITPGGISVDELEKFFPTSDYEVLLEGEHVMNTIIPLENGGFAQAPAFYMVLKKRA